MSIVGTAVNNLKIPAITGDPAMDGLILKGIIAVAGLIVPWLMSHLKLTDPDYAAYLTGLVITILIALVTFVYGWILTQINRAKQITAGIVLANSGLAVNDNGKLITQLGTGDGTPPKQVTLKTAPEIMAAVGNIPQPKAA